MLPSAGTAAEWEAAMREHLTILIPSFRCGAYLPAAVASALHSPAGRILIADDCSDEEGLKVAQALAAEHRGRVRLLASPVNRGAATNLNEASRAVETAYFAKLDGDDVLIPGYLETAFPLIANHPRVAVLAGHELRIESHEAMKFQPELLPAARSGAAWKSMAGAAAYRFIIRWSPNPTSSGVIYRTDAFREVGGYDKRLHWGEDWEIWLRFARKWDVAYIDSPSALYRIHRESTTARAMKQNRLCYGYDAVFRRAAEMCEFPEVRPLIRRRMLEVAKMYLAAGARQLRQSRRGSMDCCRQALRALQLALATDSEQPAARRVDLEWRMRGR
jgi:glycosyltransferase involved in cell wall biosynthesis